MRRKAPRAGAPDRRPKNSSAESETRLETAFAAPLAGIGGSPRRGVVGRSRPRVGRPSLLNPSVQENIVRALKAGSHLKHAVEGFGVSYATGALDG